MRNLIIVTVAALSATFAYASPPLVIPDGTSPETDNGAVTIINVNGVQQRIVRLNNINGGGVIRIQGGGVVVMNGQVINGPAVIQGGIAQGDLVQLQAAQVQVQAAQMQAQAAQAQAQAQAEITQLMAAQAQARQVAEANRAPAPHPQAPRAATTQPAPATQPATAPAPK